MIDVRQYIEGIEQGDVEFREEVGALGIRLVQPFERPGVARGTARRYWSAIGCACTFI